LEGEQNIYDLIRDFIIGLVEDLFAYNAPKRSLLPDQIEKIYDALAYLTGLEKQFFFDSGISTANSEDFEKGIINFLLERYDLYRRQQNEQIIKSAEKWLILETID